MYKIVKIFFIIISFIFIKDVNAQSTSDCEGALPFCTATGEGEPTVSPGEGNVINETALACVDNEGYSTWYTFTPTSDGIFNFILNPVDQGDDYDWALFDITGHTCSDIPNDASLLVSCNSWGDFGSNGPTGISSTAGGIGNSNGPGTTNGPPFNEDLDVFSGNTYVLMVSNWSESTEGFNIDVSSSTATGVYTNSSIQNLNNDEICLGESSTIDINFIGDPLGPITYQWEPPELFVDPNVEDPSLISPIEGTTDISVFINNGPCAYSKSAKIRVGSIEYEKENLVQNLCVGEQLKLGIDFTGIVLPSGLKYNWYPENLLNNSNLAEPTTIQLYDTTTFYFDIENGPCFASDSLIVFIHNDTVMADFEYFKNDNESTIPIEADFTKLSIGDSTWLWSFGDSTTSTEENPYQHEFPGYDTYEVQLVVKSASTFCVDTAIKIIQYPDIVYPNIVTPNEDGNNDKFWIKGLIIGTSLKVYNRWGKLVFEQDNYMHEWRGGDLSDGLYFVEFVNPKNELKKGWLQILK